MSIVLRSWNAEISAGPQAWAFSTLFCFFLVFLHAHPGTTAARKLQRTARAGRSKLGIATLAAFSSGQPAVGQFWIQCPMAMNCVCSDCWRENWRKTLPSISSVTPLPSFQLSPFLLSYLWRPRNYFQYVFVPSQPPPSFVAFFLRSSPYLFLVSHDHYRQITPLISAIEHNLLKWIIPFTGLLKEKESLLLYKAASFFSWQAAGFVFF